MIFATGQRPYVIAEIGANHNGDMAIARRLVEAAKAAGADAVKFQSWDTTLFSKAVYEKNYFLGDDYRQREDHTLKSIVEAFAISADQLAAMRDLCRDVGIAFSSTPFSVPQLEHLVRLGVGYLKIASMDLNNFRLLRAAGASGLAVVLSTGFGTLAEIDSAVREIEAEGNRNILILHCVSLYPPEDHELNLLNMGMLREAFGYPVGFSDHSIGIEIPMAAMALGAVAIEKHFTLDKSMFGWDHKVSADPAELAAICRGRDRIHAALGSPRRVVGPREMQRRAEYRRSIVALRALRAGDILEDAMIDFRRPGTGIGPENAPLILGRRLLRDVGADELLDFDMFGPATH